MNESQENASNRRKERWCSTIIKDSFSKLRLWKKRRSRCLSKGLIRRWFVSIQLRGKPPAGKLQAPHYRLQGKCPTTNTPFGPLALAILFVCEDAQDAVVIWPVARFPAIALFEGSV